MDDDDRYYDYGDDWSITDDPGFEDAAREWADANAEELIAAYAESDLEFATLEAHKKVWPLVERSLERAKQREASGDYDEAAFHYSRALEGYVRAVYLNPVFDVMTRAFQEQMKVSQLLAHDLVPSQLKNAKRLLLFALLGAAKDSKDALAVRKAISGAMESKAWRTRDRIDHTLHMPDADEMAALKDIVQRTLETASKPMRDRIAAEEEHQERLAEEMRRRQERSPFSI